MLCPKCKSELKENLSTCFVCGHEFDLDDEPEEKKEWQLIGYIGDKITADFANETLLSYEIPSVVISKSGMFGNAGLALPSFFSGASQLFEISVPSCYVDEAKEILHATLGTGWLDADKNDEEE